MGVKASQVVLPKQGKQQVQLSSFNFNIDYRNYLFTVYLPCAKAKPYYKSTTHSYIKKKINEYIPWIWRKLIKISTISEVIGIIPEEIENRLFSFFREDYYYEHYPSYEEGDINRTSRWLEEYIENFGTIYNYGYCTSKIFREISNIANLKCFPIQFKHNLAPFEFRKVENVKTLTDTIFNNYQNLLLSRFNKWKEKNSHPYKVLEFARERESFSFKMFKNEFETLQNPRANLGTFCHESKSDKGIFFYYSNRDKKFHFPKFIINFLNFC